MPFSDPVVAGETLARSAISSPNYVQTVSGWTVNQAGNAEFGDVYIRGPGGRFIRGWLSPTGTIPVLDFHPPTPATAGWNVDAGSVYTYSDGDGHEVLGLSSPQQYQPDATGEALIDMKSGSATDAPQIVMTAPEVVINGGLLNQPTQMAYYPGQRGYEAVTMTGVPNGYHTVSFPTPFPAYGSTPMVLLNIESTSLAAKSCYVKAVNIGYTGFQIYVDSNGGVGNLNWNGEDVSWLALA